MFSRETVILECAASRVAFGVFSLRQGRLRLEQHVEESLPVPVPGEDRWVEQTQAALAALRGRIEATGPVTLVLPPHLVLAKIIRPPRFERAKREKLIRFAAEEAIPCALADVVWDHVSAAEHELEVLLSAVKLDAIESLCAAVRTAGFGVCRVLPSPLATLAAFRLAPEAQEPSLWLNLGARSTTLLMVEGRRFVVRTLALGAHGPVAALGTRLTQEITRSVLYFRREGGWGNPVRVQLSGGGAKLAGLGEMLATELKMPVGRLDVTGMVERDRRVTLDADRLTDLVGAAATQLRPRQTVMNLLPPSLQIQQNHRRRLRLRLAGATLITAAVLWPLLHDRSPVRETPRGLAVIPHQAPPPVIASPVETPPVIPADEEAPGEPESADEHHALQLTGYFGGPDDYRVAFVRAGQPGTLLARSGDRLGPLGLTLRSFAVMKVAVPHDDGWPVYEVAWIALLHDDHTGGEVVLDSRDRKYAPGRSR